MLLVLDLTSKQLFNFYLQRFKYSSKTANTTTNLPYAVVNLAIDRFYLGGSNDDSDDGGNSSGGEVSNSPGIEVKKRTLRKTNSSKSLRRSRTPNSEHDGASTDGKKRENKDIDKAENELGRAYRTWMEEHFRMHDTCLKPVRSANDSVCQCGREIQVWGKHAIFKKKKFADVVSSLALKWTCADNMRAVPTSAYGLVSFRLDRTKMDDQVLNEDHLVSLILIVRTND